MNTNQTLNAPLNFLRTGTSLFIAAILIVDCSVCGSHATGQTLPNLFQRGNDQDTSLARDGIRFSFAGMRDTFPSPDCANGRCPFQPSIPLIDTNQPVDLLEAQTGFAESIHAAPPQEIQPNVFVDDKSLAPATPCPNLFAVAGSRICTVNPSGRVVQGVSVCQTMPQSPMNLTTQRLISAECLPGLDLNTMQQATQPPVTEIIYCDSLPVSTIPTLVLPGPTPKNSLFRLPVMSSQGLQRSNLPPPIIYQQHHSTLNGSLPLVNQATIHLSAIPWPPMPMSTGSWALQTGRCSRLARIVSLRR